MILIGTALSTVQGAVHLTSILCKLVYSLIAFINYFMYVNFIPQRRQYGLL